MFQPKILFWIRIDEKTEAIDDCIQISGCCHRAIKISAEDFSEYLDKLVDAIKNCAYGGKMFFGWGKFMRNKYDEE